MKKVLLFILSSIAILLPVFAADTLIIPPVRITAVDSSIGQWGRCLYDDYLFCSTPNPTGVGNTSTWQIAQKRNCSGFSGTYVQYVLILEFATGSVPDDAEIDQVILGIEVDSVYTNTGSNFHIQGRDMLDNGRPSTVGSDIQLYADATDGNSYCSGIAVSPGVREITLNSTAIHDLDSLLPDNWFALSLLPDEALGNTDTVIAFMATPETHYYLKVIYNASVSCTVRTDFDGGEVIVDSTTYSSPYTATWVSGDAHTIEVDSVQIPTAGVKYEFRYWSDGGERYHELIVPDTDVVYVAHFEKFYRVWVNSTYGTATGEGWYTPGASVNISVEPETVFNADSTIRHIFQGWVGSGSGSYTGSSNIATVTVNEPITETAQWDTMYLLDLSYSGIPDSVPYLSGGGWYPPGDTVNIFAEDSVYDAGVWYHFDHWSGAGVEDSTSNNTRAFMDYPRHIVAVYVPDPELQVFPPESAVVFPGDTFSIPAIMDALLDITVDSFQFDLVYDTTQLEFDTINFAIIPWDYLEYSEIADTVRVFVRQPGPTTITPPETLFFYHFTVKPGAPFECNPLVMTNFRYDFADAETHPGTLCVRPETVSVTITNDFGAGTITIDGTSYPAPYSAEWVGGESHTISAESLYVPDSVTQLRFAGWSDSVAARERTVAPISDTTFTALYDTFFYLDVASDYGTVGGEGFYRAHTMATFSVSPETVYEPSGQTRHIFTGWAGDYVGTANPGTIWVSTPKSVVAQWETEHYVALTYTGCGSATPTLIGEGWHTEGDSVSISADSLVTDGADTFYFVQWSGGEVENRFSCSTRIFVSGPDTITAVYGPTPFFVRIHPPETVLVPATNFEIPIILDSPVSVSLERAYFEVVYDPEVLSPAGVHTGAFDSLRYHFLPDRIAMTCFGGAISPGETLCTVDFLPLADTVALTAVSTQNPAEDLADAETDTGTVLIQIPVELEIASSYEGARITVDGAGVPISATISAHAWDTIDLATDSVQYPAEGVKLLFEDWSGTAAREITVVPGGDTTISANFAVEYRVEVRSAHGGTAGGGWYSAGAAVGFSVSPDSVREGESYYLFAGWDGVGTGSYSGSANPGMCYANSPITETALWSAHHHITLGYTGCGAAAPTLVGGGWYSADDTAAISAGDSVSDGGTWYYFSHWDGPALDPTAPSTGVVVDGSHHLTAVYSAASADFVLALPETVYAAPGEYVLIPVLAGGEFDVLSGAMNFVFNPDFLGVVDIRTDFETASLADHSAEGFVRIELSSPTALHFVPGDTILTLICVARDTAGNSAISVDSLTGDFATGAGGTGILAVGHTVSVRITTCAGCTLIVNGAGYVDSFSAEVPAGAPLTVEAPEYQRPGEGEMRVFSAWSDGGARRRTTRPESDTEFSAIYETRYRVEVLSPIGTVPAESWHALGDTVEFSVSPTIMTTDTAQFVFAGWQGAGAGSYTGTDNPASCVVSSPITETARWDTLYRITISVPCEEITAHGAGFHRRGEWAEISAPPQGCGLAFHHWTGGIFADSTRLTTAVLVSAPTEIEAVFVGNFVSPAGGAVLPGSTAVVPIIYHGGTLSADSATLTVEFADTLVSFLSAADCGVFAVAWDSARVGNLLRIELVLTGAAALDDGDTIACLNFAGVAPGEVEIQVVAVGGDFAGIGRGAGEIVCGEPADVSVEGAGEITFDGETHSAPFTAVCAAGSYHTIAVADTFTDGGLRLIFSTWSDGETANPRTVEIRGDTTFSALYDTMYFIRVVSPYGEPRGEGWYRSGDSAYVWLPAETLYDGRTRRIFVNWSGTISSAANPFPFAVAASATIPANWAVQHYLSIVSEFGGEYGEGWQDDWSLVWAQISPETVEISPTCRAYFVGWTGDTTTTANPVGITITAPTEIVANWQREFYIAAASDYGTVSGAGWYSAGDTAEIVVSPTVAESTDTSRLKFAGWYGLDAPIADSAARFEVSRAESLWALWRKEFFVQVNSGGHGTAFGTGWYALGDSAEISISPDTELVADGVRWKFVGWGGTGIGAYSGEEPSATIRVGSHIVQTANWERQFRLDIDYSGLSGVEPEITGAGYHTAHSEVEVCAQPILYYGEVRYHFDHWSGGTVADSAAYCTTVSLDTAMTITANYAVREISPIDTITGDLGDTLKVPIMMYSDAIEILNSIQFDLHYPAEILHYVRVEESPTGVDWSSLSGSPSGDSVIIFASRTNYYATPPETLLLVVFTVSASGAGQMWCADFRYSVEGFSGARSRVYVGEPIPVRIQNDLAESSLVFLDGRGYLSPLDTAFYPGEPHTIGTISELVVGGGTALMFSNWSDGGAFTHTISLSAPDTITAYFQPHHWLEVVSRYGDVWGEGWYPAGDSAYFGVAGSIFESGGVRRIFAGWSGAGSGAYSGDQQTAYAVMSEPITETARWDVEYRVRVSSSYGATAGDGWYPAGATATVSVSPETVYLAPDDRRVFAGWSGISSADNPAAFEVNSPKNISALWREEFLIATESLYGAVSGAGWYSAGDSAEIAVSPTIVDSAGNRFVFAGWTGLVDTGSAEFAFEVSTPGTLRAVWNRFVLVSAEYDWGTVEGTGYYPEGDTAVLTFAPETVSAGQWRYVFAGWVVGVDTVRENPLRLRVENPLTVRVLCDTLVELQVLTEHSAPFGGGFYPLGSDVVFGVEETAVYDAGTRYVLTGWAGAGPDSYTGGGNPAQISGISAPTTEIALWTTQYLVDVLSDHGAPTGGGYYDYGDTALVCVEDIVDSAMVRYVFAGWEGDVVSAERCVRFEVWAPITIEARWDTLYRVELVSPDVPDTLLSGDGFYVPGSAAEIRAPQVVRDGVRLTFLNWTGLVDTASAEFSFAVDSPGTLVAHYTAFDVSPQETLAAAPGTLSVPIILHDTLTHAVDTVSLVLFYPAGLTFADVVPAEVPWDSLGGQEISGRVRIFAARASAISLTPPETLFYARFVVPTGISAGGEFVCDSLGYDIAGAGTAPGWFAPAVGFAVSISTDCACPLTVDGAPESSPYSAVWTGGEVHTVAVPETVDGGAGERFVFVNWSDGETAAEREIAVWSDTSIAAHYRREVAIGIFNPLGLGEPTPAPGTYWTAGDTISADAGSPDGENHAFCTGYEGFGALTDGSADFVDIPPDSPAVLFWLWGDMFPVSVESPYGAPEPEGTVWCFPGETLIVAVDTIVYSAPDVRRVCLGWTGEGGIAPDSGGRTFDTVVVSDTARILWHWGTQYRVELAGTGFGDTPPALSGAGWYFADSTAGISAAESTVAGDGTRYFFRSWRTIPGGGALADSLSPTTELTVDTSYTVVANYRRGARLVVRKNPPHSAGWIMVGGALYPGADSVVAWYPAGDTVSFAVSGVDTLSPDSAFVFRRWDFADGDTVETVLLDDFDATAEYDLAFRTVIVRIPAEPVGTLVVDGETFAGASSGRFEGWWLAGNEHSVSVSARDSVSSCQESAFQRWSDGVTSPSRTILADSPESLSALYWTKYLVQVVKNPREPHGWIEIAGERTCGDSASAWLWQDSTVAISVSGHDIAGLCSLYTFSNWSGGGTDSSLTITIAACTTLVANYSGDTV
ncbi:hypothetical protein J7K99_07755, partial [bacterium]|nr:hypothetical protein [bacterium]